MNKSRREKKDYHVAWKRKDKRRTNFSVKKFTFDRANELSSFANKYFEKADHWPAHCSEANI